MEVGGNRNMYFTAFRVDDSVTARWQGAPADWDLARNTS